MMKSILLCLFLGLSLVAAVDLSTGYFELNVYSDGACSNIHEIECLKLDQCYGKYGQQAGPTKWFFYKYTASNTDQTVSITTYSDSKCINAHSIQSGTNVFSADVCHAYPFDKPLTGTGTYESFRAKNCTAPATPPGTYTEHVAQVKFNADNCGGGISKAVWVPTNTCTFRKMEYNAGVLEETESAYILYDPNNDFLVENEWADNTMCSGTFTSNTSYVIGTYCGDEKWFTGAYVTPDTPASGAASGERLFPSSAISNTVISSGLFIVLALFAMFMQKF